MRAAVGVVLLGCQRVPAEDNQRYLDALHLPPAAALEACTAITARSLRGDCEVAAVARLVAEGARPQAEAACAKVTDPVWRDECWFTVADTAALLHHDAATICARAVRYEVQCRKHVLEREISAMALPLGAERSQIVEIAQVVQALQPKTQRAAQRTMANRLLGMRISQRWSDVPFDPALCGAVPAGLCRYAYWSSVVALHGKITAVCLTGQPTLSDNTVAFGMSGFTLAGAPVAQAVWAEICAQVAAGTVDPLEIGALEPALAETDMLRIARSAPPPTAAPSSSQR